MALCVFVTFFFMALGNVNISVQDPQVEAQIKANEQASRSSEKTASIGNVEASKVTEEEDHFTINKPEYENAYQWLQSYKENFHSKTYDPFQTKEDYIDHLTFSGYAYAVHYYNVEKDPKTKEALEKVKNLFFRMVQANDLNEREKLIGEFDRMYQEFSFTK
jgi:hypothetical protein